VNALKGAATAAVVAAGESVAQAALNAFRNQEEPAGEQRQQAKQGQSDQDEGEDAAGSQQQS
jgi:hypothetical protein